MSKFYTFEQNATGGNHYDIDDNLAHFVIIEADNAEEANQVAESIGIYFDGCVKGIDCNCCGDRWYPVDEDDAETEPKIYGTPVKDYAPLWQDGEKVVIHYKDGRKETLKRKENEKQSALKKVREKKKAAEETLEEAWARIFSSKLTDQEREKLVEVKALMDRGKLSRRPEDMYTAKGTPKKFSKAEALRLYKYVQEELREGKIRALVEKMPTTYRLITTEEQLEAFVECAMREPLIAVDTETTGLDVYDKDVIVGISMTLPSLDAHVYIPVAHGEKNFYGYYVAKTTDGREIEQLPRSFVLEMLRGILESDKIGKVLHNAVFDAHMFYRHGITLNNIAWDTQVSMHLLNENEPSYRLKDLATKYLNEPSDTFDDLFGKNCRFDTVPLDVALAYAAKDTDITWRLYKFQREHLERLPKLLKIYEKVENPLIPVVIGMERAGFVMDQKFAEEYGRQLSAQIEEVEAKLREHFGDMNLNSPVQLAKLIYDDLKLGRKLDAREAKKRSTDKNVLKKLAEHHEGIKALLDYRKLTKIYGTYVDALPKQVKNDGRVHGQFKQASTVTGRFSSNNPNLQNLPGEARRLFIAPDGHFILGADFSQQEPRLLAHFSQEPVLIEAYRAGKDLYTTAAAETFGLPESECMGDSPYRKMMKMGILAVMYGTGPKTLAKQLKISEQEAEEFIEKFYRKHPKVKQWIDDNVSFARKHGYVEMLGGRKRRLPEIHSADKWERLRAERQCTNAIIQGSAAIQTKLVMIKLFELCKQRGWQLAATIHDEVLLYVPKSITLAEVREIEDVMINTVKLAVPSKTDIEVGIRWGESVKFDSKNGTWFRTMEKGKKPDLQSVKIVSDDPNYALKKMYDGIAAGWTPGKD